MGHGPPRTEQPILLGLFERILGGSPRFEHESFKQPRERAGIDAAPRHEADGVLGARGQGADRAGQLARQLIEQDRFADVGSPHDGDDKNRVGLELGEELVVEQLEPLGRRRGGDPEVGGGRFQPGKHSSSWRTWWAQAR